MKWKKYNEIQLTKNKMDLNNRKMTNHPPFPVWLPVALSEKTSTLQYGYRKCGTHAQVFFQTLEDGNSKNEIR